MNGTYLCFFLLSIFFSNNFLWANKCELILPKMNLANQDQGKPYSLELGSQELHEIPFGNIPSCIAIPENSEFLKHAELEALPIEVVKSKPYIWDHKLNFYTRDNGFEVYEIDAEPSIIRIKPVVTLILDWSILPVLGRGQDGVIYQYDIAGKTFAVKIGQISPLYAENLERLQFTGLVPKYYGVATTTHGSAIFMEKAEGDLEKAAGTIDDTILEKAANEMPYLFDVMRKLKIKYTDIKPANFLITKSGIKAADIDVLATPGYEGTAEQKLYKTLLETKVGGAIIPKIGGHNPSAKLIDYLIRINYKKYQKDPLRKTNNLFELFDTLRPEERAELVGSFNETLMQDRWPFGTRQINPWFLEVNNIYNNYIGKLKQIYDANKLTHEFPEFISDNCFLNIPYKNRKIIRDVQMEKDKTFTNMFLGDFEELSQKLSVKETFENAILGLYYPYAISSFCDAIVTKSDVLTEDGKKLFQEILTEAFEDAFPSDSTLRRLLIKLRNSSHQ